MRANQTLKRCEDAVVHDVVVPQHQAHNAGVSVSATKPEIATDTAIVTANCRYISPIEPAEERDRQEHRRQHAARWR